MITIAAFRANFPEFKNAARYPDGQLSFWQQVGVLLLNTDRWGLPAPFVDTTAVLASGGSGYVANEVLTLAGGVYSTPVTIKVKTVDGTGTILTFEIQNPGAYTIVPTNPVAQKTSSGNGIGATFNLTFQSGPYTEYDIALQLFMAHNMAIERRAQDEADVNAVPGTSTGPIASKSVDKVSVSYDVAVATIEGMGDYNLTTYGTRLARLIRLFGMGPVQISNPGLPWWSYGGCFSANGPGWNGPIAFQGIVWDM